MSPERPLGGRLAIWTTSSRWRKSTRPAAAVRSRSASLPPFGSSLVQLKGYDPTGTTRLQAYVSIACRAAPLLSCLTKRNGSPRRSATSCSCPCAEPATPALVFTATAPLEPKWKKCSDRRRSGAPPAKAPLEFGRKGGSARRRQEGLRQPSAALVHQSQPSASTSTRRQLSAALRPLAALLRFSLRP